jgi:uncharacterized membrane protein YfcA
MVPLIFLVALLYSSVGHAGASGYIAVMTLFHQAPEVVKPTALLLNIFVSLVATWKFYRAGCFSWRLFWPLAVGSVPFAFLGGSLIPQAIIYKQIVGVVLLYAAFRVMLDVRKKAFDEERIFICPPNLLEASLSGSLIGFLSGLIGVGGGIFLTPYMLIRRWSDLRTAAGVSAAFILVNSFSGLLGFLGKGSIPSMAVILIPSALAGGYIGASIGSRRLPVPALRALLGVILFLAAGKFICKL